ncbi:MAG: PhzF family phenazine biosynthesis isomerase, partial [Perlucidibaca sp.]
MLRQYQVDAFSPRLFAGNPAAVCPLPAWPEDQLLQAIAAENNLSETAFLVAEDDGSQALRWFTPVAEVDLCGHATLASAHVLFRHLGHAGPVIRFHTRSGELLVRQRPDGWLEMDFPARPASPCPAPPALARGLGREPLAVLAGDDYVAVFADSEDILALQP